MIRKNKEKKKRERETGERDGWDEELKRNKEE